ncbi:MAG: hypothetical protein LCH85_02205 [Chloroflexi bacterium]|nr:hypothetical protein [Chloroflexota bacterium]
MKHLLYRWGLLIVLAGMLIPQSSFASGIGTIADQPVDIPVSPDSTMHGMTIIFAREGTSTAIYLRLCSDAPYFQMRSESVGIWRSEVYNRSGSSGGCSPSNTEWWRMVINIASNSPEVFRIYATANDVLLSEGDFMERAARTDCRVTGHGTGTCSPVSPGQVSVPRMNIDEPHTGQVVSGMVSIRGWAVDLGSLNGSGVTDVHVRINGNFLGAAQYPQARPDLAGHFGDARFINAGYLFTFDAQQIPAGHATISLSYRSGITGQWHTVDRVIAINHINVPPHIPQPSSPSNGSTLHTAQITLQAQDMGDPDNGPNPARNFQFVIERVDGTWSQASNWVGSSWPVTVPRGGDYRWRVQAGDGQAGSEFSGWVNLKSTLIIPADPSGPYPQLPHEWNVPYFWQGDSRWSGVTMQSCGGNIGPVGCALTSLAMLFQYYGVDKNPSTLNSCMGNQACPMVWAGSRLLPCGNNRIQYVAWPAFSYQRLEQELRKAPVILEISHPSRGLHFLVVLGGSGTDPGNYIVNDPGIKNGARTTLKNSLRLFQGFTPSSMRIYDGTPATTLSPSIDQPAAPTFSKLALAQQNVVGAVNLYRNTDTDMILELTAQSNAGDIQSIQVWTDQYANDAWQPYSQYVSVPFDQEFFVRFRDSQGNVSEVFSAKAPSAPDSIQQAFYPLYLPVNLSNFK